MTYQQLWHSLTPLYDAREARAIVSTLLEELFGMTTADIICHDTDHLDSQQYETLMAMMRRLGDAEPVQYVLGQAPFMHRMMHVEPGVLIPRPETEVLCQWIIDDTHSAMPQVVDIGCGSGCIAITLALEFDHAHVTAIDYSEKAIAVTRQNACRHHASLEVKQRDALAMAGDDCRWDIIVSNPPYVRESEKGDMHPNVTRHEPSEALFVTDDDPLVFYRAIGRYATTALRHGGSLYFECNTALVDDTSKLLRLQGLENVEKRSDQFGRPRFIKAIRP